MPCTYQPLVPQHMDLDIHSYIHNKYTNVVIPSHIVPPFPPSNTPLYLCPLSSCGASLRAHPSVRVPASSPPGCPAALTIWRGGGDAAAITVDIRVRPAPAPGLVLPARLGPKTSWKSIV